MKKLMMICLSFVLSFSLLGCSKEDETKKVKIGIVQHIEHTSLNTIRDAIVDQLEKEGYTDGNSVEIDIQNAGGDNSVLKTICDNFKANDVDVIIAIATPSAAVAAPYAEDIPVIFSAVEDPVSSGFMDALEKPNKNITGTSDKVQVDAILDVARDMYPSTKTIGFLYSTSEDNSIANLKKVEDYAKKNALNIEKAGITGTADIQAALSTLLEKVDIVFSPTDNTVASAMAQVSAMCKDAQIPMFTGADSMVQDGGFASYGINYETLGSETADMAIKVLNGTDIKEIPVKIYQDDLSLYINKTTATALEYDKINQLKENYNVIVFE